MEEKSSCLASAKLWVQIQYCQKQAKILRCGDDSGLPEWVCCHHRVLVTRRPEAADCDMTMESKVRVRVT